MRDESKFSEKLVLLDAVEKLGLRSFCMDVKHGGY